MMEQLLEAWRTANQAQLLFIEHLPQEGWKASLSTRGGRNLFDQIAHTYALRLQWLEVIDKTLVAGLPRIDKGPAPDAAQLREAILASGTAIEQLIRTSWEAGGKLKGYKKGLIPFLTYLIAHEAHHRGHALLTLKQSGSKIPEPLKWGLWG